MAALSRTLLQALQSVLGPILICGLRLVERAPCAHVNGACSRVCAHVRMRMRMGKCATDMCVFACGACVRMCACARVHLRVRVHARVCTCERARGRTFGVAALGVICAVQPLPDLLVLRCLLLRRQNPEVYCASPVAEFLDENLLNCIHKRERLALASLTRNAPTHAIDDLRARSKRQGLRSNGRQSQGWSDRAAGRRRSKKHQSWRARGDGGWGAGSARWEMEASRDLLRRFAVRDVRRCLSDRSL